MSNVVPFVRLQRPIPPESLQLIDDFAPDQGALGDWVQQTFIDEGGPLCNPRHEHLRNATIGWLWTTAECTNRDKAVAGQCQLVAPKQKKWGSAMKAWQLHQWFGLMPDFVIIISADFARDSDDWSFCALIEHELCHAAQDVNPFGEPRFGREGNPIFRLVSHDVEEFTDVVARYGTRATGVAPMIAAANAGPSIGQAEMSMACGTCAARIAA